MIRDLKVFKKRKHIIWTFKHLRLQLMVFVYSLIPAFADKLFSLDAEYEKEKGAWTLY